MSLIRRHLSINPLLGSALPTDEQFFFKFNNNVIDEKGLLTLTGGGIYATFENGRKGDSNGSIRFQNTLTNHSQYNSDIVSIDISSGWSCSVWLKPEAKVPNNDAPIQFQYTAFLNSTTIYSWYGGGSGTQFKLVLDTAQTDLGLATSFLSSWAHHCFTVDSSGYLNYYINGSKVVDNVLKSLGKYHQLTLGFGGGGAPYNGNIDDLRYFNRVLSEIEILALYNE